MSARVRIWLGVTGLFLGMVSAEFGARAAGESPPAGEGHPQLTENEYRLVAGQSQARAAERLRRKAERLAALTIQLDRARIAGNGALERQLSAVISRLEAGSPPLSEEVRWSRAHGRKMTMRSLWTQFGTKLHDPAVVAEFDTHAWRLARLERVRQVANFVTDAARREALSKEATTLIAAEGERHRDTLSRLLGVSASSGIVTSPPSGGD